MQHPRLTLDPKKYINGKIDKIKKLIKIFYPNFSSHLLILCLCVPVCMHICVLHCARLVAKVHKKASDSLNWSYRCYQLPCGYWGSNLGPLEEQLLTAKHLSSPTS